jgi:hypothetical protein
MKTSITIPRAPMNIGKQPDGTEVPDSVDESVNDLASQMNYHRQAAHALKEDQNYNDLPKDVQKQISWHLSERKRLNGEIIAAQTALNVRMTPAYSVNSLLAQVDEMRATGKKFVNE